MRPLQPNLSKTAKSLVRFELTSQVLQTCVRTNLTPRTNGSPLICRDKEFLSFSLRIGLFICFSRYYIRDFNLLSVERLRWGLNPLQGIMQTNYTSEPNLTIMISSFFLHVLYFYHAFLRSGTVSYYPTIRTPFCQQARIFYTRFATLV